MNKKHFLSLSLLVTVVMVSFFPIITGSAVRFPPPEPEPDPGPTTTILTKNGKDYHTSPVAGHSGNIYSHSYHISGSSLEVDLYAVGWNNLVYMESKSWYDLAYKFTIPTTGPYQIRTNWVVTGVMYDSLPVAKTHSPRLMISQSRVYLSDGATQVGTTAEDTGIVHPNDYPEVMTTFSNQQKTIVHQSIYLPKDTVIIKFRVFAGGKSDGVWADFYNGAIGGQGLRLESIQAVLL